MIRRIIQTLGAIAVVAVIVFTVIGRDTYVSAIEWKRVKAVAAAADKKNPGNVEPLPEESSVPSGSADANIHDSIPSAETVPADSVAL